MNRDWVSAPLFNTPLRKKHASVNILQEPLKTPDLNKVLQSELEDSILQQQNILDVLFPDEALGFDVQLAQTYLRDLDAFERRNNNPRVKPTLSKHFFHNGVRRHPGDEDEMATHLNHFIKVLENRFNVKSARQWHAGQCNTPIPAVHRRKPDIVLCDATIFERFKHGLDDWNPVHSVAEIKATRNEPQELKDTIRNKALLMFSHQPTRRYLFIIWMTQVTFGIRYYDRAGEIYAAWPYTDHQSYLRLLAGLAFCSEDILGYDNSVSRDAHGKLLRVSVNGNWYEVLSEIFATPVIRGRATVCWLVEKEGQEYVVKDTWADVDRQWQECEFLDACKKASIEDVSYLIEMEELEGGIPELISAHRRATAEKKIENRAHRRLAMKPICATILMFKSKEELLCALISQIQAHERLINIGILHRDISPSNLALSCHEAHPFLKKCMSASRRGSIIDFDYAIWIKRQNGDGEEIPERKVSRVYKTGTLPFMSMDILSQENASHSYQHDLESFLYVLLWICSTFEGPGRQKEFRHVPQPPILEWASRRELKLYNMNRFDRDILPHFTSYFQDFKDLALKLYEVMFPNKNFCASESLVVHADFVAAFKDQLAIVRAEDTTQPISPTPPIPQSCQLPNHIQAVKRYFEGNGSEDMYDTPQSDPFTKRMRLK